VSLQRTGLKMFWECQAGAPKGYAAAANEAWNVLLFWRGGIACLLLLPKSAF